MKRILSVVLLLALCLSLFACGKQPEAPPANEPSAVQPESPSEPEVPSVPEEPQEPEQPEEPEQPDTPIVPQVVLGSATTIFKNESDDPVLQVDMTLPHSEQLSKIDSYYKAMYDDLTATYSLSREDAARQRAEYLASGWDFIPWRAQIKAEITRNDGVTLSVLREVYENLGGAYPTVYYRAETYDIASQGRLVLGDLFLPGADYLSRLPVVEPDQLNFTITSGTLMLCTETETVSVPLSDLSDILKPQYHAE